MDLELATSEELITELLKRTTFAGWIVSSPESYKGQALEKVNLSIHFSKGIQHCYSLSKHDYKTLTAHAFRHIATVVEEHQ